MVELIPAAAVNASDQLAGLSKRSDSEVEPSPWLHLDLPSLSRKIVAATGVRVLTSANRSPFGICMRSIQGASEVADSLKRTTSLALGRGSRCAR